MYLYKWIVSAYSKRSNKLFNNMFYPASPIWRHASINMQYAVQIKTWKVTLHEKVWQKNGNLKKLNLDDYPGVFGHVSGNTACDSYYSKHEKHHLSFLWTFDRSLGGAKHACHARQGNIQRQTIAFMWSQSHLYG